MWSLLLACQVTAEPESPVEDTQDSVDSQDSGDTQDSGGAGLGEPLLQVDVLVIGSGPAGLSAALSAQEEGAQVLILELAEHAGGGAEYAGSFLIVGSPVQADAGVVDSVEIAASEWPVFTEGGDGQDPAVLAYLGQTRALSDWFQQTLGATILGPMPDESAGATPRIHNFYVGDMTPGEAMVPLLEDWTWTGHRAERLVSEGGTVVGATFTELATGETGWVQAGATVIATGGFVRDLDLVLDQRPELSGLELVFETHHLVQGLGGPLLESVQAGRQNHGAVGVYVHSAADPRPGFEGEALWLPRLRESIIVDASGRRVSDEAVAMSFGMDDVLLASEGRRLWAVYPAALWDEQEITVPQYNAEDGDPGKLSALKMEELGVALRFQDPAALALGLGLNARFEQTVVDYNAYAAAGLDPDFAKSPVDLYPFNGDLVAVELVPGVAKCFTGAAVDLEGRVVDEAGAPIPGLYGAGEVAGMLGSPAVGAGFSGSISAVYWTGRRAGLSAAAYSGR